MLHPVDFGAAPTLDVTGADDHSDPVEAHAAAELDGPGMNDPTLGCLFFSWESFRPDGPAMGSERDVLDGGPRGAGSENRMLEEVCRQGVRLFSQRAEPVGRA